MTAPIRGVVPREPASFEELKLFASILCWMGDPQPAARRLNQTATEMMAKLDAHYNDRERGLAVLSHELRAKEQSLAEWEAELKALAARREQLRVVGEA